MSNQHPEAPQEELHPDAVAQAEFTIVRRGFEPGEVKGLLSQVANALNNSRAREVELARRLKAAQEVEAQPRPSIEDLDDDELTGLLGEKTAQVLHAARASAADIEQRAREKAERVVESANDDALRVRSEAERSLRSSRETTTELEKKAERKAKELRQAAETDAEQMRRQAEAALTIARNDAKEVEVATEAKAASIVGEAEDQAARLRAKSEAVITKARSQAEVADKAAKEKTDRLLSETKAKVEEMRTEAEEVLGKRTAEAEKAADQIKAKADAAYEERVAAGRSLGREQVAEARVTRERVLRELSRSRQLAHVQIEQLKVGRERLLESFKVVRGAIDAATGEMDDALPAAQEVARRVVDQVGDDDKRTLEELEATFQLKALEDVEILSDTKDPGRPAPAVEASAQPSTEDGNGRKQSAAEDAPPAAKDPAKQPPPNPPAAKPPRPPGTRAESPG